MLWQLHQRVKKMNDIVKSMYILILSRHSKTDHKTLRKISNFVSINNIIANLKK